MGPSRFECRPLSKSISLRGLGLSALGCGWGEEAGDGEARGGDGADEAGVAAGAGGRGGLGELGGEVFV